eukprot:TRINITY_DN4876_c0_g1_i1.p1 TRINITY_DN4876_c0_g1~~TRINITY_DN4876_c0_g1_i1.p1  ORF type:complete len:445 (+),score=152.11 TRINITY_DN4876_c0_g1_i1:72-1337(+)
MGERKVLNKYYPPDFDPALIPRAKRPKNGQVKVRMMLPMSVRCNVCGEYMYKGKKYNSKKETVVEEDYLGIKIFRFYMKCTRCSSEFTIKTDPQNADYQCEVGVGRNFEPWRATEKAEEEARKQREEEEKGDAMKALEHRTIDSKAEMDILDALDEMRALNARNAKVTVEDIEAARTEIERQAHTRQDAEDEAELAAVVFRNAAVRGAGDEDDVVVEEEGEQQRPEQDGNGGKTASTVASAPATVKEKPETTVPPRTSAMMVPAAAALWDGVEGDDPVNRALTEGREEEIIADDEEEQGPVLKRQRREPDKKQEEVVEQKAQQQAVSEETQAPADAIPASTTASAPAEPLPPTQPQASLPSAALGVLSAVGVPSARRPTYVPATMRVTLTAVATSRKKSTPKASAKTVLGLASLASYNDLD